MLQITQSPNGNKRSSKILKSESLRSRASSQKLFIKTFGVNMKKAIDGEL